MNTDELISNLDKLHTTEMGVQRIKGNLGIGSEGVVEYCKALISKPAAQICKRGKNWYIRIDDCIITVNASSYTIITAHKMA